MASEIENKPHFIHRGRFLKVDQIRDMPERRDIVERRQTLKGDPSRSETGEERRVGSRRLEDVIIKIELEDPKAIFVNDETLKKVVEKNLQQLFEKYCKESGVQSLLAFTYKPGTVIVETKMMYRDKVKGFAVAKGLSFDVVDNGVFTGSLDKTKKTVVTTEASKDQAPEQPVVTGISSLLGFPSENLKEEIERLAFKVFIKCLNEVHPVTGDFERDALKQDVSLEQRIIFIAGRHYPKSEKSTFKTIINQVFNETIKKYNNLVQLEAEVSMLEERYRLSNDNRLLLVIQGKKAEFEHMEKISIEQTVRTLYLYLDYFKDLIKVGTIREQIENKFERVNDKQIEVLSLRKIHKQLSELLELEEKVNSSSSQRKTEYLGYLKWLKNEITREIYFTRHLWINNMKGKFFIENAIDRTISAIEI